MTFEFLELPFVSFSLQGKPEFSSCKKRITWKNSTTKTCYCLRAFKLLKPSFPVLLKII